MQYEVPSLPYKYAALEPFIDEATMRLHHTKHHQAYVDKLNAAFEKHPNLELLNKPLDELLKRIEEVPEDIRLTVRNQGGGHWNHSFFWSIMAAPTTPGNPPTGLVAADLEDQFGSYDEFRGQFGSAAMGVFGSGWVWLVVDENKKLQLVTSANQDSPAMFGAKPILGLDVWEHAYYLKYQNRRAEYIDAFTQVINWDKVNELYKAALS